MSDQAEPVFSSWLSRLITAALIINILYTFVAWSRDRNARHLPLPPGPVGKPIIGNLLQVPREREWLTFIEWGKQFGPLIYLNLFGQSIVVINSRAVATGLLDKRSAIYSDRPKLTMVGELVGWERGVTLIESGLRHKNYRKLLHNTLSQTASKDLWPLQESENKKFLKRLLETPQNFRSHIRRTVGASIIRLAYGHEVVSDDDRYIKMAEDAQSNFSVAATPNAFWVDFIPWLKYIPEWVPGAGFQRKARRWREELQVLTNEPFENVKSQIAQGNASPSYVSRHLEDPQLKGQEEDIKWSALSLYTGGADSTVAAILTAFLALALNPEAQARAQAEIDSVVGRDRLPSFSDRGNLPFITACVKETFRWKPVLPIGVAHRVTKEDDYNGYRIPENTTIITNLWAMLQDPSIYPEPETFRPERFLGTPADAVSHHFGFGRRICPGMWNAEASVFISIATVLAIFDIRLPEDKVSRERTLNVEYTTGMISHPGPFDLKITPRSMANLDLL
ncbi:cytochrome P450 [Sistotremastrum suecicum HHB10207 ss-3]|uniref:Cytochrome P450 n=1 Tax=Sistotremastrum suecicum HHB10207 ss-3 TaxID=1314776 RepID=A0A166EN71_9AGAM|nr:cytochrome P450 [Sistotremastrum suecicum HHB10207 ss-3]